MNRTFILNEFLIRKNWMIPILILVSSSIFGQTIYAEECGCIGATGEEQTLYNNTIHIGSASVFQVTEVNGLYSLDSESGNLTPIITGTSTMVSGAESLLETRSLGKTDWHITLTDGSATVSLSNRRLCSVLDQSIQGDMVTCAGNTESYSIPFATNDIQNLTWTVDGGTIVEDNGTEILVTWDNNTDQKTLSYTAQHESYDNSGVYCDIGDEASIEARQEVNGPLACNNLENISLNGSCSLEVFADMILEAQAYPDDSYDVELRDMDADTIINGPMISMQYVNKTIEVKIIHDCSGNSCWGYIRLEDKSLPPLTCPEDIAITCDQSETPEVTGFPVPDDVVITSLGSEKYLLQGYDNCTDATLSYTDHLIENNICDGDYSKEFVRQWYVEDVSGNSDTCSQRIGILRATLDDIEFPTHVDDILGDRPSLEACSNYKKNDDGYPHPDLTGRPIGTFCMNALVAYDDIKLDGCGASYKIRREWTVHDLCSNETKIDTQYISVLDRIDPTCSVAQNIEIRTDPHLCTGTFDVPVPEVTDCSDWSYTIGYKMVDDMDTDPYTDVLYDNVVQNANGTYSIRNLPYSLTGYFYIVYTITDDCGNNSRCHTRVKVVDDVAPNPICLEYTTVSLNDRGIAWIASSTFDNGSYDNCGIERIEIRRMNNSSCGITNVWGDRVKFCCEDLDENVMVQMRVWDRSGNHNECMVEVNVEDKRAPVFTYCPADTMVNCTFNPEHLEVFGAPSFEDNCSATLSEQSYTNINDCGEGTIRRVFTATDGSGNKTRCTQTIQVVDKYPFYINAHNDNDPNDDIIWPLDHVITDGCVHTGVTPDDLPTGKQRPVVTRNVCGRVGMEYEDVFFYEVDGACAKILRKWSVVDWCQYNEVTREGLWSYTQIIKVLNNTPPTITSGCAKSDFAIDLVNDCDFWITARVEATDDCTEDGDLTYSYTIDIDNNGSVDIRENGERISKVLQRGNHKVTWIVSDQCGNETQCPVILNIRDTKPPTPVCYEEIVTVVMQNTGSVEIWAKDFLNKSYDNCFAPEELTASFDKEKTQTSRVFSCDDLNGQASAVIPVDIWVHDPDGNKDYCSVSLKVQDNVNACNEDQTGNSRHYVSGIISLMNNTRLPNVPVMLAHNGEMMETMTDGDGRYTFEGLPNSEDIQIIGGDLSNHRLGLNTRDLIEIQRHLLNLKKMDSPYKKWCADVDHSGRIDPRDLLTIRKLILGLQTEIKGGPAWGYVDRNDPTADQIAINGIAMNSLTADYDNADLWAIKKGDVNFSYKPNNVEGRSNEEVMLSVTSENNTMTLTLHENDTFEGIQLALDLPQGTNVLGVSSSLQDFDASHYYLDGNVLRMSYAGKITSNDYIKLVTTTQNLGLWTNIASQDISSEIYKLQEGEIDSKSLVLRHTDLQNDLVVQQNIPNPFNDQTTIQYSIGGDQAINLTVTDVWGKVVYKETFMAHAGNNQITLSKEELPIAGIYHYTISDQRNSITKRLIITQ